MDACHGVDMWDNKTQLRRMQVVLLQASRQLQELYGALEMGLVICACVWWHLSLVFHCIPDDLSVHEGLYRAICSVSCRTCA